MNKSKICLKCKFVVQIARAYLFLTRYVHPGGFLGLFVFWWVVKENLSQVLFLA